MSDPRVSFYPLKQAERSQQLLFACRLAEKARQLGHRVHLLLEDATEVRQLDELLWQFRPDSFLPHTVLGETSPDQAQDADLTLGTADTQTLVTDTLINLSGQLWEPHEQFSDIREIVGAAEADRDRGRELYRHYQNLGYALETKQL